MGDWIKQKEPLAGSVFFRGNLAPRAEEFAFLKQLGVEMRPGQPSPSLAWCLLVAHPKWGRGELLVVRNAPMPPGFLIDLAPSLSTKEKETFKSAGTAVTIRLAPSGAGALRQRKCLLWYLGAMLGDDGVGAADHCSQQFWSRHGLDDELQHDADADVEALFTVHMIQHEGRTEWLHTHGLDTMGAFDFDILNTEAHQDWSPEFDLIRAIVFSILEGRMTSTSKDEVIASPGGRIAMVPVADFDRRAAPAHRALRDMDEGHRDKRSVVCDPRKGLSRVFGRPRPSRFLARAVFERILVAFSERATALMADRARRTYPVLRRLLGEYEDLKLPVIAKLGYPTTGGGREHLWFEVHRANEHDLDATLINQPFGIPDMKQGDRARHDLGLLTDWAMMTPVGAIKPYRLYNARALPRLRDSAKA